MTFEIKHTCAALRQWFPNFPWCDTKFFKMLMLLPIIIFQILLVLLYNSSIRVHVTQNWVTTQVLGATALLRNTAIHGAVTLHVN